MSRTTSRLASLFVGALACASLSVVGASSASAEDVTTEDVVVGVPGQPCVIVGGSSIGTSGVQFGSNTGVYTSCPV
jgi:hypothetical protein